MNYLDIEKKKKEILNEFKEKYDSLSIFREGIAISKLNGKYGFVNEDGEEISECIYDEVDRFDYKFFPAKAPVKLDCKWGYINKLGKTIIGCKYDDIVNLNFGLIGFCLYGKWGVINEKEEIVIPPKYQYLGSFKEKYAKVKLNDKYGFIDKTGKEILPCKYDNIISQYSDDIDLLEIQNSDNKYGIINKQGKEIIPCKYDMIICLCKDIYKVKLDNKWGLLNLKRNSITDIKYNFINDYSIEIDTLLNTKLFLVSLNNNYIGIIDDQGKEIVPMIYSYLNKGYMVESRGLIEAVIKGEDESIHGFIDIKSNPLKFIPFVLSIQFSIGNEIKYTKYKDDFVLRTKRNIYYLYDFESYIKNKKYILKGDSYNQYIEFINKLTVEC